jgi:uncharacterized protein
MDALVPAVFETAPVPAETPVRQEKPAWLLFLAVVWVLAAVAAGIGSALVVGVAVGVHNHAVRTVSAHAWTVTPAVYGLICIAVTDMVLLLAAWARAKVVGRGDVIAGLGGGPIERPRLLVVFAIVGAAVVVGWMVLLSQWLNPEDHTGVTALLKDAATAGPIMQGAMLLCMAGLSPLWEELFFRGWLWTGLRRHWRPLPVMLATALPWVLMHLVDGARHPLHIIPAAIILSLARQYCGGVRASLVLHVLANLSLVTLAIVMRLAGHP